MSIKPGVGRVPAVYRTPGTRLVWDSLAGWCGVAHRLDKRRASAARNAAIEAHVAVLPTALVRDCCDPDVLHEALSWWISGPPGFCRPGRGQRATAPQTLLVMTAKNRLSELARDTT